MRVLLALLLMTRFAAAEGERAGDFDYYVLSLSWSPNWCASEGRAKGAEQCDSGRGFGWIMHGLWPQYESGWPSFCFTQFSDPSPSQTGEMVDAMGSSGLAWYQWKKHGRCTGLSAADYFATARAAYDRIVKPAVFRKLSRPVDLPASVVEAAFLKENPQLSPDMITITCKRGYIQEARICLNKSLEPRTCGRDVIKDCTETDALFENIP